MMMMMRRRDGKTIKVANLHPTTGPVDKWAGFETSGATPRPTSSVLDLKSTVNQPANPLIGPTAPSWACCHSPLDSTR